LTIPHIPKLTATINPEICSLLNQPKPKNVKTNPPVTPKRSLTNQQHYTIIFAHNHSGEINEKGLPTIAHKNNS
jgi:hypothetical protein